MRRYWDTSSLVEALHDESFRVKVTRESAVTRSHSFSEVFSTLTVVGWGFVILPMMQQGSSPL